MYVQNAPTGTPLITVTGATQNPVHPGPEPEDLTRRGSRELLVHPRPAHHGLTNSGPRHRRGVACGRRPRQSRPQGVADRPIGDAAVRDAGRRDRAQCDVAAGLRIDDHLARASGWGGVQDWVVSVHP